MTFSSLGDMAQSYSLRYRNTVLKNEILRLGDELATGQANDLAKHLGGSFARLSDLERSLRLAEGYQVNISEAKSMTDTMQSRLEQMSDVASKFANTLIASSSTGDLGNRGALAKEAEAHFDTFVGILNSRSAGRSLFAGDATDQAALATADTIFAELDTVLAGATSALDVQSSLDTWFNDPAGFDTIAYLGGSGDLAPIKLSETSDISAQVKADQTEFKDMFKALAKASYAQDSTLLLSDADRQTLWEDAGLSLMTAQDALIEVQASLGLAQEQIETWGVRNESEMLSIGYARGALLNVDPYETATELEAAQFQLESLYTITARLSQLSLVNFLR